MGVPCQSPALPAEAGIYIHTYGAKHRDEGRVFGSKPVLVALVCYVVLVPSSLVSTGSFITLYGCSCASSEHSRASAGCHWPWQGKCMDHQASHLASGQLANLACTKDPDCPSCFGCRLQIIFQLFMPPGRFLLHCRACHNATCADLQKQTLSWQRQPLCVSEYTGKAHACPFGLAWRSGFRVLKSKLA